MKRARQNKILDLISRYEIDKQEELLRYLRESGFDVTQATVSRDIRELGLVKVSGGNGRYRYVSVADAPSSAHVHGRFETIFRASVVHVDYAGNLISVKCHSGMANAACELFDARTWENVVGTLAGDNNFFVLMRSEAAAKELTAQLWGFISP